MYICLQPCDLMIVGWQLSRRVMTKTRGNFQFKARNDQAHIKWRNKIKKVHVFSHSMSTTTHPFTGNTKTRQIDDSTKLGFMVYMMNCWWKKVCVWVKFESRNPPISLRHANSLSMKNFSAYISLLSFFNDYVTNLNSKNIQIGNNIDEILYDHDGIKMNELLLCQPICVLWKKNKVYGLHDELMMEKSGCVSQIWVQKPSHIVKAWE